MSLLSTAARTVTDWMKLGFPEEVAKRIVAGGVAATAATQSDDAEAGFVTRGGKTLLEAWHGSPHKFDKFSMDAIGTGEGAQAYGHGLYFADSEDVARGYRDALTQISPTALDGFAVPDSAVPYLQEVFDGDDPIMSSAASELLAGDFSPSQIRSKVAEWADIEGIDSGAALESYDAMLKNIPGEGHLYRTEIDVTPESLLDWDKPLSEQSEVVQEIARPYIEKLAKYGWENPESKKTGADLYSELTVTNPKASHEIASGLLSDRGIKGIRYLDGDSRAAGDGTSNYVIFDDSLINIAERGSADPRLLAGIAAGGGGMSAATAMSNKLAAAQAVKEQGDIRAPNSSLLHDFTMGARDLERRLEGSPASLLFPEGLVEYLEQANRAERPNAATRSWALLDFL
jgi:hypothetical protein